MTDDAGGGTEHGFAPREIAAGEVAGNQRGGLRYGVGAARSLGADGTGDDGVDWGARAFVEGATFGGVGHVGEGLGADVADEAGEAVAAFPVGGAGEPREVFAAERGRPADGGVAEVVGVDDLLAVGAAGGDAVDDLAVVVVAGEEGLGGLFFRSGAGLFRDAEEGDGLRDDGGGIEIDEEGNELAIHEGVGVREERVELGGEAGTGGGIRFTHPGEGELPGAEERELEGGRLLREVEPGEGIDQAGLKIFLSDAGECDEGFDGGLGISFGEGALGPVFRELVFEGDAGGSAHKAVSVREVRPEGRDGFGAGACGVKDFEGAAEFGLGSGRGGLGGSGVFGAGVGDAVEGGLSAATADGKIHGAVVRVDDQIGEREGFS